MDRDGTKAGYNLTRAVSDAVRVPVIASGGVGTLDHLTEGVVQGGASLCFGGEYFHFGTYTVPQAKAHWPRQGLMSDAKNHVLDAVFDTISDRHEQFLAGKGSDSRTAKLFEKGVPKIAQKVGEEATEVVIEAIRANPKMLVEESGDLLYSCLYLEGVRGVTRPSMGKNWPSGMDCQNIVSAPCGRCQRLKSGITSCTTTKIFLPKFCVVKFLALKLQG